MTLTKKQRKQLRKVKTRKYPQNEIYKVLKQRMVDVASENKYLNVDHLMMRTMVPDFAYESEATTISTPDGSHVRFKSRAKSIDISRVWVNPENHGKGVGTLLMETLLIGGVLDSMVNNPELRNDWKIILECTGEVGLGENYQETPVSQQVRFFKRFGFVVDRVDYVNDVYHMVLSWDNFNEYLQKVLAEKK